MIYIHRQDLVDWIKKYPYKSKQQIEAEATAFCMRRKQQSNVGDTRIRTTVVDSDVKSRNKQLAMEIRQKYQLRWFLNGFYTVCSRNMLCKAVLSDSFLLYFLGCTLHFLL